MASISARIAKVEAAHRPTAATTPAHCLDAMRHCKEYAIFVRFCGLLRERRASPIEAGRQYEWRDREAQREGEALTARYGVPFGPSRDFAYLGLADDDALEGGRFILAQDLPLPEELLREWQRYARKFSTASYEQV